MEKAALRTAFGIGKKLRFRIRLFFIGAAQQKIHAGFVEIRKR